MGGTHLHSRASQALTIRRTPQAELLHPSIHQRCVSVPGCWAEGCGSRGDHPALPALGEALGSPWRGGGGAGPRGKEMRS